MRTTVSLTPRSASLFLSSAMSLTRFSSACLSACRSASAIMSCPSGEPALPCGDGGSYSRMKLTKTAGTLSACFRTQTGAINPSGFMGLPGVKGESGE